MRKVTLFFFVFAALLLQAQNNISVYPADVDQILKGAYTASNYAANVVIDDHEEIACLLDDELSADSLLSYLEELSIFHTRHTYSDTTSQDSGIGAARRWIHHKLQTFSSRNENRLRTGYLEFDQPAGSCPAIDGLKNVLGILPGTDAASPILIIEAHFDSRCEERCNDSCLAPGIDDNGSGTALVMELARVMSRYTFEHTILFMLTTGEEQGLLGATAMAEYCQVNNIAIKAVQNNDVIGGIVCGQTASPPGCDPAYAVDSTRVRLYASPTFIAPHQGFARTIKIYYDEKMKAQARVPMEIEIINLEDRVGRGGDHIPFRLRGFRNVRFSSAHEHGDASTSDSSYSDHQHTSDDILGEDFDNDGKLDTFYVDVNYLRRNALINGISLDMLALGPEAPEWTLKDNSNGLLVEIQNASHSEYRVGVRKPGSGANFEAVYRFSGNSIVIPGIQSGDLYFISVAAIDSNHIMSPFTAEKNVIPSNSTVAGTEDNFPYSINCHLFGLRENQVLKAKPLVSLVSVVPNPLSDEATIGIEVLQNMHTHKVTLSFNASDGREVQQFVLNPKLGLNEFNYSNQAGPGLYFCVLKVDNQVVDVKRMVVE